MPAVSLCFTGSRPPSVSWMGQFSEVTGVTKAALDRLNGLVTAVSSVARYGT